MSGKGSELGAKPISGTAGELPGRSISRAAQGFALGPEWSIAATARSAIIAIVTSYGQEGV